MRQFLLVTTCLFGASAAFAQDGVVTKNGVSLDIRSSGREALDDAIATGALQSAAAAANARGSAATVSPAGKQGFSSGGGALEKQVNDPSLQVIQNPSPATFRPFVQFTQSETSLARRGRNIVAGYNNSSDQPFVAGTTTFQYRYFSGFSTSNDGGRTWKSGSVPPAPGAIFTFGDPSVDVDRRGNFYYAGLGANAAGVSTINVNKSTDGGRTWGAASIVQADDGGDKEWLAVGKDPTAPSRDNLYVSWTSFQQSGAQLRFGRSIDGGATWQTQTLFAPTADPDPTRPQNSLQFSNPVVDDVTGALYIPFLQFSDADQDFIRMLKSTDGGQTFAFVNFNVPGQSDPTLLPVTQPGTLQDCGNNGGARVSIHSGPNLGGRFGLPQYAAASRLVLQPAIEAHGGKVIIAWNNSTSTTFGDPSSGSNILVIRSANGGATWSAPVAVTSAAFAGQRHVLPSIAVGVEERALLHVSVAYYTQNLDGSIDVYVSSSKNGGASFAAPIRVTSQSSPLAPTNVRLPNPPANGAPGSNPANTTNYDRIVRACYNLGEYIQARGREESVDVLFAASFNNVTHPVNVLDPLSGVTHRQQDVFFKSVSLYEDEEDDD